MRITLLHVQVVAEHFFREGRFEAGDTFAGEAQLLNADALKQPYIAMHSILKEVQAVMHSTCVWPA